MSEDSDTLVPCPECEAANGYCEELPDAILILATCQLCDGTGLVDVQVRHNYRSQNSIPPSMHCDKLPH